MDRVQVWQSTVCRVGGAQWWISGSKAGSVSSESAASTFCWTLLGELVTEVPPPPPLMVAGHFLESVGVEQPGAAFPHLSIFFNSTGAGGWTVTGFDGDWSDSESEEPRGTTPAKQQSKSTRLATLLLMSRLMMAGKTSNKVARLKRTKMPAWREKALRAGIGIIAAAKKAQALLTELSKMLTPDLFRISPVWSSWRLYCWSQLWAYVCVSRNMLSTPSPKARKGTIWVVEALKTMPIRAQKPNPAATVMATNRTPAMPSPD